MNPRYKKFWQLDETCPEGSQPRGGKCARHDNSGYLKGKCDKGFIWSDRSETCIRMSKEEVEEKCPECDKDKKDCECNKITEGHNLDSPILPLGSVNLQTGDSKYFNVYETWDDSTAEVWQKTDNNKIILVFTAGDQSLYEMGNTKSFIHDQTGKYLFTAKMIDFSHVKDMKIKLSKYGKSLFGYTYK
jgi:hypothetical protein